MVEYNAPITDMQYLLFDVFAADQWWQQVPELSERLDRDISTAMLEEAGKLARNDLLPVNRSGDEAGVRWHEGGVATPAGFKAAYDNYCDNGFAAFGGNPAYGGLGMPKSLGVLIDEIMWAANSAFYLYPTLTAGACMAIDAHADEDIKQRYLPNLYSGEWSATMCLTEAHAGSDLGLIRTKAEPVEDGSYRITGTKIFITGGEHDLADNIIHLVLAKLPDAPAGVKGISLFLVPKFALLEDGSLGERNAVSCGSVEHKMGINASATCVMNFDAATGYLVGPLNRGLMCMFTMMNYERLSIGIQGLGAASMSYQTALAYAKDRRQGRAKGNTDYQPDSILQHPDVRRMLLTIKVTTEAGRAFAVYLGTQMDRAKYSPDERAQAEAITALLTPIAKAFFSDLGLESTVNGQQVLGGHGYVREWGQEQLVRDVRIAQIYEGTNGIQAQDLLQRKILGDKGQALNAYLDEIKSCCRNLPAQLTAMAEDLEHRIGLFEELTQSLLSDPDVDHLGAVASDYLHVLGYLSYGFMWLRMMSTSTSAEPSAEFDAAKQKSGQFYFAKVLPRVDSLISLIQAGGDPLLGFEAEEF